MQLRTAAAGYTRRRSLGREWRTLSVLISAARHVIDGAGQLDANRMGHLNLTPSVLLVDGRSRAGLGLEASRPPLGRPRKLEVVGEK